MTSDRKDYRLERFENQYGSGLKIVWPVSRDPLHQGKPDDERARDIATAITAQSLEPLEARLDLVRGVGPATAEKLRAQGFRGLVDLLTHPKLAVDARRVLDDIEQRNVRSLLSRGARDVDLIPLFRRQDAVLVDIETTGFSRTLPLFMIGIALPRGAGWQIRQLLARGLEDEAAVLAEALDEIKGRAVCVSYNGKAFDEPFVQARLRMFRLGRVVFELHVDLMHACRRLFRDVCPDFRLTTVARTLFERQRVGDVPGHEIPDLYYRYMREGTLELLQPLLQHNADDLADLGALYDRLCVDEELTPRKRTGEIG